MLVSGPSPHPAGGSALRLRLGGGAERRIGEIRDWFRAQGREEFLWWVGDSATPVDLADVLRKRGAEPYADEPLVAAMVLTEEPPVVDGFEIRRVENYEDFLTGQEIGWEASDVDDELRSKLREQQPRRWEEHRDWEPGRMFLAYDGDEPVAFGGIIFTSVCGMLSGPGTLPTARGGGAFRALVRARWDETVRRGVPALAVEADAMSRPILERVGFRKVAELRILLDRSAKHYDCR